jgi:L-iditol 2-dehydrogenase
MMRAGPSAGGKEKLAFMKALVVDAPGKASIREVPTPIPAPNQALVRVVRAGICGTDLSIYTGQTGFVRDGLIKYPVRIGHEWSGVVEAVGKDVVSFKPGDRVVSENGVACGECDACRIGNYAGCVHIRSVGTVDCWDGCFAEYMLMPEYHLFHIKDDTGFDLAALMEPLSIAYDGFKGQNLTKDSTVVVFGTGPIGMSGMALARYFGAGKVVAVGRKKGKLTIAGQLGATHAIDNTREDAVRAVREISGGAGADLILETSGDERCLIDAMHMAKGTGTIAVIGFYEREIGNIPIDRLVLGRVTLRGAAGCFGNMAAALHIAESADLNLTNMITHRARFGECLEFFEHADRYAAERIKVMVEFD